MLKPVLWTLLAATLLVASPPAFAITATIKGAPSVSVEVPGGFEASDTEHGLEIKTPDEEVMVWFETYKPDGQDSLVAEHGAYWAEQGVSLGAPERTTEESDGHKVVATAYKAATWKGDPTVVRYLFIDGNFPSKELILMSVWASPEGYKAYNAELTGLVDSLRMK